MSEVVVTRFELELGNFQQQIEQATKDVEGFDKAADDTEKSLEELSGKGGSAAKRIKELGAVSAASTRGIKSVGAAAKDLGGELGNLAKSSSGLPGAFGKVGQSAVALGRSIIVALGPVGLVIAGIVAAIVALGRAFFGTQEGADRLRLVTETISVLWQRLIGLSQELAQAIVDAFGEKQELSIKNIGETITNFLVRRLQAAKEAFDAYITIVVSGAKGAALAIKGIFDEEARAESKRYFEETGQAALLFGVRVLEAVTGISGTDLENFAKGAKDLFDEASESAQRLTKIYIELGNARIRQAKEEGRLQLAYEEQLRVANNINASADERKEAALAAISISEEEAALRAKIVRLEIEELKIRQSFNDTGREELLLLARKEAELERIQAQQLAGTRRVQNIINTIESQAEAQRLAEIERVAKARIDAEGTVTNAIRAARREQELAAVDSTERAVLLAQERAAKEIEAVQQASNALRELAANDADALKTIREQEATARLLIEQNLTEQIAAIRAEADQKELERLAQQQQQRIDLIESAGQQLEAVTRGIAQGQEDIAKSAAQAVLAVAFQALEAQVPIWTARILGESLVQPDSILTGGASGLARAGVITAILRAALAGVRGAVTGAFHDGGLVGRDGGTKVHGGRDGWLTRVERGEYVMPTATTARYMPYLEAMRDGTFERMLQLTAPVRTTSTPVPSFNDRGIVGAIGSSTAEERRQTVLLEQIAKGMRQGHSKRYMA